MYGKRVSVSVSVTIKDFEVRSKLYTTITGSWAICNLTKPVYI